MYLDGAWGENKIRKKREKARLETEKNGVIWGRIAKALNNIIRIKIYGDIEAYHINHILNAIFDFALFKA